MSYPHVHISFSLSWFCDQYVPFTWTVQESLLNWLLSPRVWSDHPTLRAGPGVSPTSLRTWASSDDGTIKKKKLNYEICYKYFKLAIQILLVALVHWKGSVFPWIIFMLKSLHGESPFLFLHFSARGPFFFRFFFGGESNNPKGINILWSLE